MNKEKNKKKEGFKITQNKGFHITFNNGITVSCQWGYGNYCTNRNIEVSFNDEGPHSNNCEIGIWDINNKWITRQCPYTNNHDDVEGWISPDELIKILDWAKNL